MYHILVWTSHILGAQYPHVASDYCIGQHSYRETQPESGAPGTAVGRGETPYWKQWMLTYWMLGLSSRCLLLGSQNTCSLSYISQAELVDFSLGKLTELGEKTYRYTDRWQAPEEVCSHCLKSRQWGSPLINFSLIHRASIWLLIVSLWKWTDSNGSLDIAEIISNMKDQKHWKASIETTWLTFIAVVIRMTSQQQHGKLEDVRMMPSETEEIPPTL